MIERIKNDAPVEIIEAQMKWILILDQKTTFGCDLQLNFMETIGWVTAHREKEPFGMKKYANPKSEM